ncbi:MAG: hypothetical protein ACOX6V_05515 [Patescibacteria group bacterium]|jgi:hypothetical protein
MSKPNRHSIAQAVKSAKIAHNFDYEGNRLIYELKHGLCGKPHLHTFREIKDYLKDNGIKDLSVQAIQTKYHTWVKHMVLRPDQEAK